MGIATPLPFDHVTLINLYISNYRGHRSYIYPLQCLGRHQLHVSNTQQIFVDLQDTLKTSWRHVLKRSSTRLQRNNITSSKTSWRHLQDVKFDEKLLRWRRLQDILKTCLEDVLNTYLENILKTCLEDVFKMSWRQTKCLSGISVSNNSKCVYLWSNKSIFSKTISDESKANPKCVN